MPKNDESVLAGGTVIAGCAVDRRLGHGGMGVVYLATHLRLKKPVAVKILLPGSVGNKQAVARFKREAELAAKINHPNVVRILDIDQSGEDHFILMDYVKGMNLTELVQNQGGPLHWKQALRLVQLAARGAAAVHQAGLIHRDIKPSNIMLSTDKQVLLMDFGLAREVDGSEMTGTGVLLGTPAFMSPEQSRAKPLDPRSDIFSLGGTLFYLLTAKLPYDGEPNEMLMKLYAGQPPRRVHDVNPAVPREVSDLVRRIMAPRREDRPADAAALAAEIGRLNKKLAAATGGGETDSMSAVKTGVNGGFKPVPDDLVPLELIDEERPLQQRLKPYLPWIGSGLVLCVGALVLMLALGRERPPATGGGGTGTTPTDPGRQAPPPAGMVPIPAGRVQIGNAEDDLRRHVLTLEGVNNDPSTLRDILRAANKVVRQVQLPAYWIDKYEVTNADYAKFVTATSRRPPKHWNDTTPPDGKDDHPVTNVSHLDALAYAAWAGKKLPTEEQWARAFRGDKNTMYPWGNTWDGGRANVLENKSFPNTCRVTATPEDVSPLGVFNMVGNVSEMLRDKIIDDDGDRVVITHGANWNATGRVFAIAALRYRWANDAESTDRVGFRCVREEP